MQFGPRLFRPLLTFGFCVLTVATTASAQRGYQDMTQQELVQVANAGDARAQIGLGVALLKGRWGSRQFKTANRWFQAAATNGSPDAQAWLGNSYLWGLGLQQNRSVGIQLVESAASKGSAVGIRLKGVMIDRGLISTADPRQAADHYELAANMNDPDACDAIGSAFLLGKGRPRDIDRAAAYFNKGAVLGDDSSLLHLGQMYEAGNPFHDPTDNQTLVAAPDFDKALQAYVKSARMGNRLAAYKAGMILNNERTGLSDKAQAAIFLEQAARHQYAPARVALAQMLSTGDRMNENRSRALALYNRAAEQGEAQAAHLAASLKKGMTQQEIQQAQAIETAITARDHRYSQ